MYPAHYYYLELNTAKMLHDLNVSYDIAEDAIEKRLRQIEEDAELSFGRTSADGSERSCEEWSAGSDRRTWNRKDNNNQCDDSFF